MEVNYYTYDFGAGCGDMTFYIFKSPEAPADKPYVITRDASKGFPWFKMSGKLSDEYFKEPEKAVRAIEKHYVPKPAIYQKYDFCIPLGNNLVINAIPGIVSKLSSGKVDINCINPDIHDRLFLVPFLTNQLLVSSPFRT